MKRIMRKKKQNSLSQNFIVLLAHAHNITTNYKAVEQSILQTTVKEKIFIETL